MAESLSAHQSDRILELGTWRDEGRLFAVGKDGEVWKHQVDQKENSNEYARKGPAGREGAAASGPAAPAESPGQDRGKVLRARYLQYLPEIENYYPSLITRQSATGLWAIVQSCPLGRDGPRFWICLFLPYSIEHDPMAFAFSKISPLARPVGPRHTNFPEASICAFTADDDAWRPGDNPIILLNLYAEWLICHLYLMIVGLWPGRQAGLDATYRLAEFHADEWCFCDSRLRYGDCHLEADKEEVEALKKSGLRVDHGLRKVPQAVLRFVRSHWRSIPSPSDLSLHDYAGAPPRD